MIIDFHAHTWSRDDAEEMMAREARRHGVDRICISGLASWLPDLDEVKSLNDRVYKATRDYPDLYLPFVYLNPLHGRAAMDELERGLDQGAVGIKLWISCWIDHPAVAPILERAIAITWSCCSTRGTRSPGTTPARATRCASRTWPAGTRS